MARRSGTGVDQAADGSIVQIRCTVDRAHPGMNAPNVISVEAGATGEVTYSLAKKAHLLI